MWGYSALVIGLVGTWLAGKNRLGWLAGVISSLLWIPPMWYTKQTSAVIASVVSAVICLRNWMVGGKMHHWIFGDVVSIPEEGVKTPFDGPNSITYAPGDGPVLSAPPAIVDPVEKDVEEKTPVDVPMNTRVAEHQPLVIGDASILGAVTRQPLS